MPRMRLVHSACGGELVVDTAVPHMLLPGRGSATDVWYGVKCSACNEHLGLLANVDEAPNGREPYTIGVTH
jgi:hypothetical protein